MAVDFQSLPKFDELPIRAGAPPESNWGVFGDDDQLGCVNLLTEQGVVDAARLVRRGKVFRLDTPIGFADPPLFDRKPFVHTITGYGHIGFLAFDDQLDNYNTQEGAQWDGLGHVGHVGYDAFYNGYTADQIEQGGRDGKLGIHLWSDKMVGRGVLVDLFKYRNDQGRPVDPGSSDCYTLADLEGAIAAQGVEMKPGAILLVRTGWLQHYLNSPPAAKEAMGTFEGLKACGLEPSREMAAWFWDNRVAALGTDCPSAEPFPFSAKDFGSLHYRLLTQLGLPIGEQFDLEALAADSAADGVYESMVVSAPLYLVGGIASPPNAVAMK